MPFAADEDARIENRSMPPGDVIPELAYADVEAAAAWLARAFGFRERLRIGAHRIQMRVGRGAVVLVEGGAEDPTPQRGRGVMVRVADVDAHQARAAAAGAWTSGPPATFPFGERQYSAVDLAGHRWTFSQSVADVDPAVWGGTLVDGG